MLVVSATFFFFKQKTAYEITTGDWSSDVCSSDLVSSSAPPNVTSLGSSTPLDTTDWRRSEERRVGKECRLFCRSRCSPYHYKKKRCKVSCYKRALYTKEAMLLSSII